MKPRVRSVSTIPNARPQRTPPTTIDEAWPKDTSGYNDRPGRYLPGQLGRFPTIGIDPGSPRWATPGANLE